jgi:GDP-L-fucose synthase
MTTISTSFNGKRVLVCGASGLTGYNLFEYLLGLGAEVTGTCLLRRSNHQTNGMSLLNQTHSVDFTDAHQADKFFSMRSFDYVFICCAQSYNADVCKNNPQMLIQSNLVMTSNILSACLKHGVKKVMYMSSATVYQPHQFPVAESSLNWNANPHRIYMGIGWVKRYLEKLCEFYSHQGMTTLVVRPTNIYGRYDKTELDHCHVLPAFIMRCLDGENPLSIKTSGNGVKNFIHVSDLVRDMAKIMAHSDSSDVYNLTSNEYVSIERTLRLCVSSVRELFMPDYNPEIIFSSTPDAVSFTGLSREKFDDTFGYEPYLPFREGLEDTIKWYYSLRQTQNQ